MSAPALKQSAFALRALNSPQPVTFSQAVHAIGQGPHSFATADFDGDGINDAAISNQGDGTVTILKGLSSGDVQNGIAYPAGTAPTTIVTGDFNGDGNADWAVANTAGVISVSLGFGDGTFAAPIPFQASGSISIMAASDLNNDGSTDLVTVDANTGSITIYLNNGNGLMTSAGIAGQPGFQPQALVLRDFNGDGKQDLAVAYYQENAQDSTAQGVIAILLGNGNGTFGSPLVIRGGRPLSLETGSFSGGGFLDLLAGYGAGGSLLLYPGRGNGNFGTPITLPNQNVTGIIPGAFSGTGRTDVIAFNNTNNFQLLANQPLAGVDLAITKSHTGTLSPGQKAAQYQLNVSNAGLASSNGIVTVKDQPPANLTITAMAGTGWTCTTLPVCTRSDTLAAGQSYPSITVTANIGTSAASPLVNTATVSGTGDTNLKNNSSSDGATLIASQSIVFTAIPTQTQGAAVTLSATASSGLPVSFTSLTPSICPVSGSQATALNAGTCTVQASQPGNAQYAPATVTQNFAVKPAFTITPIPGSETVNRGFVAGGFLLALNAVSGFTGPVTLTCSGGPAGAVCTDLPATVRFYNGAAYALSGIFFPANTAPGLYTITFTGVSGTLTNTATATFTVE